MSQMPKILLVEDDPLIVDLYKTAFTMAGYEVEIAFDGLSGFERLAAMPVKPTAVLSDVMMPKMNGLQMLEEMKKDPALRNIPLIFLTNLGGEADAKHGLELGAVTYLVKSQYSPKEIVQKVKEIVAGYSRDGQPVPEVRAAVKDVDAAQ